MRLIITEHILFGELRPWLCEVIVPPGAVSSRGEAEELTTARVNMLLEAYPEIRAKVNKEWSSEDDQLNSVAPFIEMDTDAPFNRTAVWYNHILSAEWKYYLAVINSRVSGLDETVDKKYEINRVVRYVVDILKRTQKILGRHNDRLPQYVLSLIERHAMQLILDIGLRFRYLGEVEYYDDNTIFTAIINRPAPERSPFCKTVGYWRYEMKRLLQKRVPTAEYVELRKEVIIEAEKSSKGYRNGEPLIEEYLELIAQLENVVFLMEMGASFIKKNPEQLLDTRFCQEWIRGIYHEFVEEEDPAEAAHIFHNLIEAADTFMQLDARRSHKRAGACDIRSEARSCISGIQSIYKRHEGEELSVRNKKYKPVDNFVDSFNHRFMTIEEFDSVLPGTREATMRYVKNGDIRLLEISREVKFLYRADVEQFIEDNIK